MNLAFLVPVFVAMTRIGVGQVEEHFDLVISRSADCRYFNGPVCGILSMDAAAKTLDGRFDLYAALASRYIGAGRRGSSIEDLQKLARDAGLFATPWYHVDARFLARLDCPAVLNLRVRSDAVCTGHWVTFLGIKQGSAVVFDSLAHPNVQSYALPDLMTRWTGTALVVEPKSPGLATRFTRTLSSLEFRMMALLFAFLAAGISGLFIFRMRKGTSRRTFLSGTSVVLTCLVCAMTGIAVDKNSPVRNWEAASWMTSSLSHIAPWDDTVGADELFTARNSGTDINVVDARLSRMWSSGTIPGSENLDVTWGIHEFRAALAHLDKALPTYVFCNSEDCSWADLVATRLNFFGFTDVRLFRGGYMSYLERASLNAENGSENDPANLRGP